MAILLPTESKSLKGRLFHAGVITLLLLGGVTMVYPFLVMLSGSLRSGIDEAELDLVPDYLVDDEALYRKFLEFKYNGDINALNRAHQAALFSFQEASLPEHETHGPKWRYTASFAPERAIPFFDADAPLHHFVLGGVHGERTVPANLRRLRDMLVEYFDGDLNAYVEAGGAPTPSWLTVVLPPPRWFDRRYDFPVGPLLDAYADLAAQRPVTERQPVSLSGHFLETMVKPRYGDDLSELSTFPEGGHSFGNSAEFQIPTLFPARGSEPLKTLWTEYVRNELHPSFLLPLRPNGNVLSTSSFYPSGGSRPSKQTIQHADEDFGSFLRTTYGSIDELNRSWLADFTSFEDVPSLWNRWLRGVEKQDYLRLLETIPVERLMIVEPVSMLEWAGPRNLAEREWAYVQSESADLRQQFAARNYVNVWDELAGEGRALWNTVVYCALSIVLALLVNPLAAYGLSRFRLRGGYKALLVLMATMAFPPMVTLIPQFIVLRNLGLMNTFVALLLPLIANGYLIFLLKGFFDSLPGELYEAARIDGANEMRMFFQIAMALSKPILAVVALQTFTAAYTMFLYALLVAPDRDMWLISVWLFQYQERASSSGVYASVVIASIPTLVLFLLVQRTIMRGIVVPTEK